MIKAILDNDIGGDIDDVLALGLALNSPELELLAVTTVNTDPPMRARIAAKMTHVFGRGDIPVAPGCKERFDGAPTWCKDINGAVVLSLDDPIPKGDGVKLIIEQVRAHPGEVVLIGIGCWTNIARAFQREPDLVKQVGRLVLMGGQTEPAGPESNITCDARAAAYVLDLPVEKLLVPLQLTKQFSYPATAHGVLFSQGLPQANLVRDLVRAWQLGRCGGDPSRAPVLHDPLAVALAFDPSLVVVAEDQCVEIEFPAEGLPFTRVSEGKANVQMVHEVDRERFLGLFEARMLGRG